MMKRILAIVAMAPLATFAAPAKQTAPAKAPVAEEKGEISVGTVEIRGDSNLGWLGGSHKIEAGGGKQTIDDYKLSLALTGLYYLLPVGPGMLGVGGTFAYEDQYMKSNGVKEGETTFKLAPRAGVDVPLAPHISAYGFGELAYIRETALTGGTSYTAGLWGIGLGGGVKYFINRHLSADAGLILEWATGSSDAPGSPDVTRTSYGLQVGLSGYFNLPKQ